MFDNDVEGLVRNVSILPLRMGGLGFASAVSGRSAAYWSKLGSTLSWVGAVIQQ